MKLLPFHKASTWIYVALNPARLQNGTAARAASISADPSPFQAVIKVQKRYWFGCSLHFLHLRVQKTLCATYSACCQRNFTASPTSDCLHNAKLLWHQLPTEIRELMDAIHLAAIFGKALLVKTASSPLMWRMLRGYCSPKCRTFATLPSAIPATLCIGFASPTDAALKPQHAFSK